MEPGLWLSLLGICLLGAMSPGPSLAVVLKATLGGRRDPFAGRCERLLDHGAVDEHVEARESQGFISMPRLFLGPPDHRRL